MSKNHNYETMNKNLPQTQTNSLIQLHSSSLVALQSASQQWRMNTRSADETDAPSVNSFHQSTKLINLWILIQNYVTYHNNIVDCRDS